MLLIPAIDLKDGQCVRLKQGDVKQKTIFTKSPTEQACYWVQQGARRLHLIDLDGAFTGQPCNKSILNNIINILDKKIPIQIGGGIRNINTIEYYLNNGVSYVILGTAAVKNLSFLKEACTIFSGQIIVAIDTRNGKVATDGWSNFTKHEVINLSKKIEDYGCTSIIYTDIKRDGMLCGINIDATIKLARAIKISVIASGGLASLLDINKLCAAESEGISGVICGRAIYSGQLDFASAQKYADKFNTVK